MKTPDEIKIWLETEIAVHYHLPNPEPRLTPKEFMFLEKMHGETLAYIKRLESSLAQVERERDAAADDLAVIKTCLTCADGSKNIYHDAVKCFRCNYKDEWRWRGVCDENTKER